MPEPTAVFTPLPWQHKPLRDYSPILLLTGSAGGGKSRLAAEKVHAFCKRYPGSQWLMLRKASEWLKKSIIPFYRTTIIGNDSSVKFLKQEGTFEYANGSFIYTGGMKDEMQREAVRSIGGEGGLDGVWFEEGNAFIRKDYEEAIARMRHNAAGWRQIIISTNPGGSKHWIHTDLIKGKQASVYYSGAKDNPYNPPDYLASLDKLTGTMKERLLYGKWTQAEGAVYDTFDHVINVRERKQQEFCTWYLTCDEGYTNPAVILLVGEDFDGRWHVFREWYETGKLQSVMVAKAKQWSDIKRVSVCAVDAAAASLIAAMRDAGIPAVAAKGRVLDGIQAIQDRLKKCGDGKARLTIEPVCTNTINEFESYCWKSGKITMRDEPQKENDHAMDALRYLDNTCRKPKGEMAHINF